MKEYKEMELEYYGSIQNQKKEAKRIYHDAHQAECGAGRSKCGEKSWNATTDGERARTGRTRTGKGIAEVYVKTKSGQYSEKTNG
ncbi:hypothetical protein AX774_g261 [Zancudomyces culisetae]|uniref:Uncharacterized protein n=1 Tax=Zancudomyces culisetae TaxID=1213189 RepID=A0A1R1PYY9_ZANCU|nr:hypothetical protein AX774_g261 [Zancudomyces culisetae]|eukprot:OMH86188.1 hypothetical protein AX774_g261 [Zancudomyces culisetae]